MWSKTRKTLLENLPDKLKSKVDFQMTGYRYNTITILYENKIVLRTHEWANYEKDFVTKSGNIAHFDTNEFLKQFKLYMEKKNAVTAKDNENEYYRLFALLDKRTGERRLRGYYENGDFLTCAKNKNLRELENVYRIRFGICDFRIDEDMISLIKEIE